MATTTSPDNIFVLETSDNDTPSSWQPAMATSVQNALLSRSLQTFTWANATERSAQGGMRQGDLGLQQDTGATYQYDTVTADQWAQVLPVEGGEIPLLIPTSVTGGTVNDDGVVSFSGATSVIVQGLTSAHRVFEIDYSCSGTSSSVVLTLVTSGGTEAVTDYDRSSIISRNATTSSETVTAQNAFHIVGFANTHHKGRVSLSDVAHAVPTTILSTGGVHANPAAQSTANGFIQSFGTHRDSTAYGGVKFAFSNAQSGTLRIRAIK